MRKLGILFANYGPYHIARLQAVTEAARKMGWQVVAIELAAQEEAYSWERAQCNMQIHTVTKSGTLEQHSYQYISFTLWLLLNKLAPDVLAIAGYQPWPMLAANFWCRYHKRKSILMSDSKANDSPRYGFNEFLKSQLLNLYQAALVAGKPHHEYLEQLKFRGSVWTGYDVVDNDYYAPNKRQQLQTPIDKPYFLCVSRFLPRKNLLMLLQAYQIYSQSTPNPWHLVICGSGSEEANILATRESLRLENFVHLPGFLQANDLLPYYAYAGAFIQPSLQDQWGLVVNEAMASGLAVLASRNIGCFTDLLIEGINGYGFDPHSPEELSCLMKKLSDSPVLCKEMGKAAFRIVSPWSLELFSNNLLKAAKNLLNPYSSVETEL